MDIVGIVQSVSISTNPPDPDGMATVHIWTPSGSLTWSLPVATTPRVGRQIAISLAVMP